MVLESTSVILFELCLLAGLWVGEVIRSGRLDQEPRARGRNGGPSSKRARACSVDSSISLGQRCQAPATERDLGQRASWPLAQSGSQLRAPTPDWRHSQPVGRDKAGKVLQVQIRKAQLR